MSRSAVSDNRRVGLWNVVRRGVLQQEVSLGARNGKVSVSAVELSYEEQTQDAW